jgi:glycosyltransferase involved in cell wall biosynthesis
MDIPLSLSVALATYNGERYIGEQLDSIARQTRLPDELIISDDASTDSTPAIVQDFAQRAPFSVRFLQHKRLGSTGNFELAIGACEGDIVFLCDQDDIWYPNKIEVIERVFTDTTEAGAVFTDADVVDENLRPLETRLWKTFKFSQKEQAQVADGDALSVLLRHPVVTGATMAFRSNYHDLVLPIPQTWHDAWIALLIGATSRLVALPTPLIAYRQHRANNLGIPLPGRNRNKSCAMIYGPQVLRYESARARLSQSKNRFPVDRNKLRAVERALVFARARADLPEARLRRLPYALNQLFLLHYHRYAFGLYSFGKDLMR